jgi:alkylhydroperoxidase family enzyme
MGRVADGVDGGDLAIGDGELEYEEEPSLLGHHYSHRSIYQGRSRALRATWELPGYNRSASDLYRSARRDKGMVGSEYDFGVENTEQSVEVAGTRGDAEAVTRLADKSDAVPDSIWEEAARHYDEKELAAIILMIATTNLFNRVNVTVRQLSGHQTW